MERVFSAVLKGGAISDVCFPSLEELYAFLDEIRDKALFVADNNTEYLVSRYRERALVLPSGEENKSWRSVERIIERGVELSLARDSLFVAVGGGVICDITAFAASVYMRGASVILVPTTLLAMVDASVGGKTGFDFMGLKNFVGSFFPAHNILISLDTLKTLSDREYLNGLGEVVKHAFLSDNNELFDFLCSEHDRIMARDREAMREMVRLSLLVKKSFIERDPEEKRGIRSFLNLGHTFSHALETVTSYSVAHGEGVAWGTLMALEAGERLGITPSEYKERAEALLSLFPFPLSYRVPLELKEAYLSAIKSDKKKSKGSVKFVLLKGQGEPLLMELDSSLVWSLVS